VSATLDLTDPVDYGRWVRTRREILGLSGADLCRQARMAPGHLSAIESGSRGAGDVVRSRINEVLQMRPRQAVARRAEQIAQTFDRYGQPHPQVFGSVARGDDTPDSDIDLVTTFDSSFGLFAKYALVRELRELLTFPVDVVGATAPFVGARGRQVLDDAHREAVALGDVR